MFVAAIFSILLSGCAASVDFEFSSLYDLDDFAGQAEILIPKCDSGCVIFASTESPNDVNTFEDNLIIHDNLQGRHLSSITDLSRQYDINTSQKIPLTIAGPANISILNLNPDPIPWPTKSIVLYVVEKPIDSQFTYSVFDALNLKKVTFSPKGIITVMSAYPFTVTAKESASPKGVSAWLTGFDNARSFNADECPKAFQMDAAFPSFPGFRLNVAGPVVSLDFTLKDDAVQLEAITEFSHTFEFADAGFLTSAGFNGCKGLEGGVQTFRSGFLDASTFYDLNAQDKYRVSFDILPNLDETHKVTITDFNNNRVETITGDKEVVLHFEPTYHLNVDFKDLEGDQGFLLKYTSEIAPISTAKTTTSTKSPHTSSTVPVKVQTTTLPMIASTTIKATTTSGGVDIKSSSTPSSASSTSTIAPTITTSSSYDVKSTLISTFVVFAMARLC